MNIKKGASFLWIIFGVFIAIGGFLILTRFSTPEDSWICDNGKWVKHGNPSSPVPGGDCKDRDNIFLRTGNVVKYEGDERWSFVYEEPGSPALNVALEFSSKSKCFMGLSNVSCDDNLWEEGARAEVEGVLSGKILNVIKLTIR